MKRKKNTTLGCRLYSVEHSTGLDRFTIHYPRRLLVNGVPSVRKLVAYSISSGLQGRRADRYPILCRYDCLPSILFGLLIALVLVATIQVALVHYFGVSSSDNSYNRLVAHPYAFAGPGGLLPRFASPPPRINLHSLLNRHVPSIQVNYLKLQEELNTITINRLLNLSLTPASAVPLDQSFSPSQDIDSSHNFSARSLLTDCPDQPPGLMGRIMSANHSHEDGNLTEALVFDVNPFVHPGGWWRPEECLSNHHVAIIIPYRDRSMHLTVLLSHLHPILQRQLLNYRIFVVEQDGGRSFNKARIMNIAAVTALRMDPTFSCFIFHDVDLIPEDDRNMYSCPEQPRHMSVAIDEMDYKVPYEQLVGGVFAISKEHFFKVNGYSNLYWGWGAEDDDMAYRLQHVGLKITRPPGQVARYSMIKHKKRPAVDGRIRYRLLWTGVRRYKIDGLNSLQSLKYEIVSINDTSLYTHILIDIGPPPPGF